MSDPSFSVRYGDALRQFIADPGERRLKTAYELGRAAVEQGMSVLDVASEHTRALVSITRDAPDVAGVVGAAGDFLVESLAAFEMVQRGVTEAHRAAFDERRRARMLRELSSVFADTTVALAAHESVRELAQLVAEIAREATGAAQARVVLHTPWFPRDVEATADEPEADTWSELLQPRFRGKPPAGEDAAHDVVRESLLALDGRAMGVLEVSAPPGVRFRRDDRATVAQIAQMTAAWLERTQRQE